MRAIMYTFLNRGLNMTAGKLASQAQHAAVEAYRISNPDLITEWYKGKHYAKITLLAENTNHLLRIERYLAERGIKTALIIDEGLTEIAAHSPTALGCEIVDKDDEDISATFSSFEVYHETIRAYVELDR